ncbi:MAG TPA: hypothetical protein VGI63_09345, partial [Verrucomicrobiae bacterium]
GWLLPVRAVDFFPFHATNSTVRVIVVHDENLLHAYLADDARVANAFNHGLIALARAADATAAWHSLVTTNDVVGIKVFSLPGPLCGTRPAVVAAIARGLMAAGLPPKNIIIWDKHDYNLRKAGFYKLGAQLGVRVAGAAEDGYDPTNFYLPDSPIIGQLVWGDLEFGLKGDGIGKKSYVSKLVSRQITKIISVAPLINENDAGLCGHLFSLTLGSVDNTRRFEGDPDRLAVALPEIYALPLVGDRVVLHVTDALLGQFQGGPSGFLQYATELDQLWLGHDPVALDTLALKELARERRAFDVPPLRANYQIYTNAVLLQLGLNDPSRIMVEKVR